MSRIDRTLRQLTFANQLTLLRLVAVPGVAVALLLGQPKVAFALFLAAVLTDRLDGWAARRFKQQTALGAVLDPAADKLMMVVTYVVLAMPHVELVARIPPWLALLVVLRDVIIVIVAAAMVLAYGQRKFPPSTLGKWTTGWEMGTAVAFMLQNAFPGTLPDGLLRFGIVSTGFLVVSSGVHYMLLISRVLQKLEDERESPPSSS